MLDRHITIIGCGNLGSSIAKGIIDSDPQMAQKLSLTRRSLEHLQSFADAGVHCTSDNSEAASRADVILLAVKPYNVSSTLEEIKEQVSPECILVSLASGVTLAEIKQVLGENHQVYRGMPNIAASVNESLTCITSGGDEGSTKTVQQIFNCIGKTQMIDESLMEAATVLGACGIAFVLRFIRAMIQGGVQIGFSAEVANAIVSQTVKGSAQMLLELGEHPEVGIDKVTTPKGCTIVGLNEMEHEGFSSSLIKGIVASFDKIESDMTE
jgi:pyrroline-5-carboxylate reductase